jgi:hypothetical protein
MFFLLFCFIFSWEGGGFRPYPSNLFRDKTKFWNVHVREDVRACKLDYNVYVKIRLEIENKVQFCVCEFARVRQQYCSYFGPPREVGKIQVTGVGWGEKTKLDIAMRVGIMSANGR